MARVLVIDDRDCDRESVMALLRLHGHEVCAAADARQGLDMVTENPPEVILLDMLMPAFDGWYFLEAREPDPRLRDIPVLIMTGLQVASDDWAQAARACG